MRSFLRLPPQLSLPAIAKLVSKLAVRLRFSFFSKYYWEATFLWGIKNPCNNYF